MKPFLFYHVKTGRTSTFESVAFPGWFIASSERGQPIFLTSDQGAVHNTAFNIDFSAWTQPGGGSLVRGFVLNFLVPSVFSSILLQCHFTSVLRGELGPVLISFVNGAEAVTSWQPRNRIWAQSRREGWCKALLPSWSCPAHKPFAWAHQDPKMVEPSPEGGHEKAQSSWILPKIAWLPCKWSLFFFCFVFFPTWITFSVFSIGCQYTSKCVIHPVKG